MQCFRGKCVSEGTAIGKIFVYRRDRQQIQRVEVEDVRREKDRYHRASEKAVKQLGEMYAKAVEEAGESYAAIFEVHQMLLKDNGFIQSVEHIIEMQGANAEYAVNVTGEKYAQMFETMDDEYMRGRGADIKDISERLLAALRGGATNSIRLEEPVIVVADDLTPSEAVQMDKDKVLAYVTVHGSRNSHTAILARTMGVPALAGTDIPPEEALDGKRAAVDGAGGYLFVEPDEKTSARMREQQSREEAQKRRLEELKGKKSITPDGKQVMLYANISDIRDLDSAVRNDAEGIGLFRSEFLCLEAGDFPGEEEQFRIYKKVAETMSGRRAVIRTWDIGADKGCGGFGVEPGENLALGCRGIRICLERPEIFKTQLRALLRASVFGNIAVMYPMITSLWEIRRISEIVEEVRKELKDRRMEYGEPEQGIMIETPASVIIADELAKEVDFFSIGTNDLTQYTLAANRQDPRLDIFYDIRHPAVFRLVELIIENAHKAGIQAGICGELGADPELIREFLAMGADSFSVPPGQILPVRRAIREWDSGPLI